MPEFAIPLKVKSLLVNFNAPWFIAGGWALDLFLGTVTRPHHDIEIAVFRQDQLALQTYLPDWEFVKIVPGKPGQKAEWRRGEYLSLPIHEIHAISPDDRRFEIEILLNESSEDRWIFRRNHQITCPLTRVGCKTDDKIPYLSPEVVLLYKAKNPSPKDEADFSRALEALGHDRRRWLKQSINANHPGHPWLSLL